MSSRLKQIILGTSAPKSKSPIWYTYIDSFAVFHINGISYMHWHGVHLQGMKPKIAVMKIRQESISPSCKRSPEVGKSKAGIAFYRTGTLTLSILWFTILSSSYKQSHPHFSQQEVGRNQKKKKRGGGTASQNMHTLLLIISHRPVLSHILIAKESKKCTLLCVSSK